jgi:hypothetical protein
MGALWLSIVAMVFSAAALGIAVREARKRRRTFSKGDVRGLMERINAEVRDGARVITTGGE